MGIWTEECDYDLINRINYTPDFLPLMSELLN